MIKVGCCGFPTSKRSYFKKFSVIEIQQTFYKLPTENLAKRWKDEAPIHFEFTLKAWQLITHPPSSPTYRKLGFEIPENKKDKYGFFRPTDEVFEAWEEFKKIAKILGAQKIIFQTPAKFTPAEEHKRNIVEFFKKIERENFVFIWEPRGDWHPKEILEICEKLNLIDCVDPFKRLETYGDIKYYRLHGIGGYRYKYTDEELERLKKWVLGDKPAYVMFNNTAMLENSQRFKELLQKEGVEVL